MGGTKVGPFRFVTSSSQVVSFFSRSECPCSFLGADYEPGDVIMTSAGVQ